MTVSVIRIAKATGTQTQIDSRVSPTATTRGIILPSVAAINPTGTTAVTTSPATRGTTEVLMTVAAEATPRIPHRPIGTRSSTHATVDPTDRFKATSGTSSTLAWRVTYARTTTLTAGEHNPVTTRDTSMFPEMDNCSATSRLRTSQTGTTETCVRSPAYGRMIPVSTGVYPDPHIRSIPKGMTPTTPVSRTTTPEILRAMRVVSARTLLKRVTCRVNIHHPRGFRDSGVIRPVHTQVSGTTTLKVGTTLPARTVCQLDSRVTRRADRPSKPQT